MDNLNDLREELAAVAAPQLEEGLPVPENVQEDARVLEELREMFPGEVFGRDMVENLLNNGFDTAALRRLRRRADFFKCMNCPQCRGSRDELLLHMRREAHYYGLDRLQREKMDFIHRLHDSLPNFDRNSTFKEIGPFYTEMAPHEKQEYIDLVFLTLQQIRFRP